jgi:ABC-type nitrate/sulfonate/bicarbonate transport system permease component
VNPPEVEQALRIDRLRREVDAMARRSLWQMVGGLAAAFLLGVAIGHVVWR